MQTIGLNQNLVQTTKLSPTQIQVIRMLELPSIELGQRINEELVENPALEEGREEGVSDLGNEGMNEFDEFDDNYMPDDGYDDGRQRDPLQNEDFNYEQYVSDDETPSYMLHHLSETQRPENRTAGMATERIVGQSDQGGLSGQTERQECGRVSDFGADKRQDESDGSHQKQSDERDIRSCKEQV